MNIGIIAFTDAGYALAERLGLQYEAAGKRAAPYRCPTGMLADWTRGRFAAGEALVFVGAAGVAVRAIAPYVQAKTSDPAVVVIDELGRFVIPLLSGHIGGANRLARDLARILDAIPVITTATDCRSVFAIDAWASENGLKILNPERIKEVSARLLAGEQLRLKSAFPVQSRLPEGLAVSEDKYDVLITIKTKGRKDALRLVPPILTLGIGCRKDAWAEDLEATFEMVLKKANCHREAVCRVCSIDMKAQEPGILAFCAAHDLPFQTFSAQQLHAVKGRFASSEFVREVTGVDNVCERSAVLGSGGEILVKKRVGNGVAMALGIAPYTVRFSEEA